MDYAAIIKEIGRGTRGARPMTRDQAHGLFAAILDGKVPDLELGAILLSLRIKGESLEELLGFKAALDERTRQLVVPEGPRCVVLPTYNGARKQANLMPLVALLLARKGIPVLVQGRHDFDSRVSPFKLLAALGIDIERSLPDASASLEKHNIACLRLDLIARGLDWLLGLRQTLGVRSCGHTMAKLLDPCRSRSVRVVAVTHPPYIEAMQAFLQLDGGTAMLMRGTEGEAYVAPRRRPRLLGFHAGQEEELLPALDFEDGDELNTGSCELEQNATLIQAMLAGERPVPQSIQDQVEVLTALARRP
ncbi:MAG: DNA-binding protein YbiB [Candidatus Dactylopiibacterium carminicum]|uniref:DNA-binding protein YbiB n=1 Tax=Candidatus Dactylopiibacterium carminicum TaxID=857335 RepID=A0A272EMJ8_9RHOO|nr:DNA-binding protein YbiB [Candidatus Dactylopiibacterium carminicum]KAF7597718.1 DNA-binding protein YbiB [Candidatus Dactylopiibacterium carminicum]PAS91325.1 MAG: DNA-binding protein YbiB [Candidatus Dactylopiibacterium carminicum]PAS92107.1 MAG: DNA-binding protein YbiB [Candidatus Dactylopiibacterium carminicum]PAS94634.1 MAG: DNA-binding protein YbiB [Candidatus Dactylopiibacterium carminicum]